VLAVCDGLEFEKLKRLMEDRGYCDISVKRWKNHDWLCFKDSARNTVKLFLKTRVEQVPYITWVRLLGLPMGEICLKCPHLVWENGEGFCNAFPGDVCFGKEAAEV